MKTIEEMLEALPFINDIQEVVVKEYDGVVYKPILYFNRDSGEWSCDFVYESCGCILNFSGKTAIEAIQKATDYCNKLKINEYKSIEDEKIADAYEFLNHKHSLEGQLNLIKTHHQILHWW